MNKPSMLIVETDANGEIAWLWRTDPGKRPKLVKDTAACLQDLDTFLIHGAEKEPLEAWLRRQPDRMAS